MIDMNFVYTVGIVLVILLVLKYVVPQIKSRGFDFYREMRLGLLMFGFAFREDKLKEIADIALSVVTGLENIDLSSSEKRELAIADLSYEIADRFNIHLNREALFMIINLAVSMLPKTK